MNIKMNDRYDEYLNERLRAHVSWVTPPWIHDRSKFDAEKWVKQFKRAGMKNILFYAKFHDGYCTFNSKFRTIQPQRDFLKELTKAAGKNGLNVSIYYSASIDKWTAHEHPDWKCVDFDGTSLHDSSADIKWQNCCFNTGYREFMLGQIEELIKNYDITGFWFDMYSFPSSEKYKYGACYCKECQKKFTEWSGGRTLFECAGTDIDLKFRYETLKQMLIDIRKIVNADGVSRPISFNCSGGLWGYSPEHYRIFHELDNYVDYLSLEGLWLNDPRNLSFNLRLLRSAGKPFESTCAISDTSISWSVRNTDLILLETAAIFAHGGTHMASVDPTADGHIYDCQIDQLAETKRYIDNRKEYIEKTEPVYDVAIWGHKNGSVISADDVGRVFSGWGITLFERHILFGFLYPDNEFTKFHTVIVDGTYEATADEKKRLIDYVRNGGNLVVEYKGAFFGMDFNEEYEKMLGVRYVCESPFNVHYLGGFADDIAQGMTDYPLLIRGKAYKIKPTTAKVLATYHYPIGNYTSETSSFTRVNSPQIENSGDPAITLNHYGKGKVIYIGCNFGNGEIVSKENAADILGLNSDIIHAYPRQLADNIVNRLLDCGKTLITNAPPGVEVVLNKQENRYIVHLLNNYNIPFLFYDTQRESIKLAKIWVKINERLTGTIREIKQVYSKNNIKFTRNGDYITWQVPELAIHEMFVLEK